MRVASRPTRADNEHFNKALVFKQYEWICKERKWSIFFTVNL